jgi:hypothetical protein
LLIGNLLQSQEVTPSSHQSIVRWLLESAGLFGTTGFTLPSDADIGITTTFNGGSSIVDAIAGYDVGSYWGDFNNITTSATPLPAALPLFATGFGVMGLLGWRRKRKLLSQPA